MYIPASFRLTNAEEIGRFITAHSFGILFSAQGQNTQATHLPFVFEGSGAHAVLLSHMAKANPHWKDLDQREVLVVFPGPHAFVSSAWYGAEGSVPTWNYTAVHVYGSVELIAERPSLKGLIDTMLKVYEPDSPLAGQLAEPALDKLLDAIVGFKIKIRTMEGKSKLSQNHPPDQQQKVMAALRTVEDSDSQKIADLMAQNLEAMGHHPDPGYV